MRPDRNLHHLVLWLLCTLPACGSAGVQAQGLPNVLIVYADDLGLGDVSVYNPQTAFQTPRLDQLATEGIRFVDAHSPATICSPSRFGLLSGELVCRTGRRPTAFEGPAGPSYLVPGRPSLADLLQSRGYRTGVFGKWHLGLTWYGSDGQRLAGGFEDATRIDYDRSTPLEDGPNRRGFEVSFVTPNCPTTDPLYVYLADGMVVTPASERHRRDDLPNPGGKWRWDNDEGWKSPDYRFVDADLLFFDKTLDFITTHRREFPEQPFFALWCPQIAHAPVLPAPEFSGITAAGPRGDFIVELDSLVGRMLDELQRLGIDRDTLVIFSSDNGPETVHTAWMREDYGHDATAGWRGMKRDGWEGGHRVPLLVRWPAKVPAGQVSRQLINITDLFATLASLAGIDLPDDLAVDSYDMLPVLLGRHHEQESVRPYMLTQSFRGEFQLREEHWKYLHHSGSGGNQYTSTLLMPYALPDTAPAAPGQLYDLEHDPGETTNLYFQESGRREHLQSLLSQLVAKEGRTAPLGRTAYPWQQQRETGLTDSFKTSVNPRRP